MVSIEANLFAASALEIGDIIERERLTGKVSEKTAGDKLVNTNEFKGAKLAFVAAVTFEETEEMTTLAEQRFLNRVAGNIVAKAIQAAQDSVDEEMGGERIPAAVVAAVVPGEVKPADDNGVKPVVPPAGRKGAK